MELDVILEAVSIVLEAALFIVIILNIDALKKKMK